ncbi:NADH-ubiquinone oxidoreductase-F iron-sulfur binding region domain-containing protein [Haloimpatiens sp. FM7315]|uniref:NADH-ubiquinone oxidoreductase-F iron-sulfur binding region domain-containing protein n=1 Tax=Haloimpatiens sp. FM7315 TaxID=3298609 RepID=UPI0035A3D208
MDKLKDYKSLLELKEEYKNIVDLRYHSENVNNKNITERQILVCGGPGCKSANSNEIVEALNEQINKHGVQDNTKVITTGCFGFCSEGPVIEIVPDNVFYVRVSKEDAEEIVKSHILNGKIVERLLYSDPETKNKIRDKKQIPFYKKQVKIALRNCGIIDPEDFKEVIAVGSYEALGKVLTKMKPEEVVKEIMESGLRGRGGGGFPTGRKWQTALKAKGDIKYVICNADEGDPGAFMDRAILEGDPHSVLEAMAICGYATGSNQGYIYIRAEYPLAVKRLKIAIAHAKEAGLLGSNILGTGFDFDIEIKYGAGAFVCGEATALIHSIEGKRGEPTMKPPRTSENGLWQRPTCVNNVETFANIAPIINKGAKWYTTIGTKKSPGTKVFSLAGKINNVGLVEVPMGISLKEIIYEIGGGTKNGRALKAVQTGGPSGGCIPNSYIDIPIEYDTLTEIGSMMGSGGMIVLDEDNCMVDVAKFYLEFTVDESCGKCTPCRVGNKRLLEILNKITQGKAKEEDLDTMKELCSTIRDASLCGLGVSAPNPVLSTLEHFKDEYKAHVNEKRCPAKVCKSLLFYAITDDCIGCTKCARWCPVGAIEGVVKEKHKIDNDKCIKCGLCYEGCPVKAIVID